ncbi:MAG: Crp/Fnr family transcriptional regulator [Cyclobacteriaceae bacterium]
MNKYAQMRKHISKRIPLTEDDFDCFLSYVQPKVFTKKQFLLNQGALSNEIFYVVNGCLRAFHTDVDGNDKAIMFATDDWWITDISGFTNESKSILSIDALEETAVYALSKYNFEKLLNEKPIFERFFRQLFQHAYMREQKRSIQNLSLSAASRYDFFLRSYPHLQNKIAGKHIASYIGVTPEFLSVLRNRNANS